jgi:hypothetical protein
MNDRAEVVTREHFVAMAARLARAG